MTMKHLIAECRDRGLFSPVAYRWDDGLHCRVCTLNTWGRNHTGEVAGPDEQGFTARDSDGQPIAAIPDTSDDRDNIRGLTCDTCGSSFWYGA